MHYPANLKPDTWNLAHLLAGSEGTLAVIRKMEVNLVPKPKHTILGILAYDSIVEACDDVPRLLSHQPAAVELVPQMILLSGAQRTSLCASNGLVASATLRLCWSLNSAGMQPALKACVDWK